MKRVFCPKCDHQLSFDETKYPQGKVLAFVCPQCGAQFKIKLGLKRVKTADGFITVIENVFTYKQELPLKLGDNVVGRRNKDTEGVDVEIITSDPSMGRKHCVINVKQNAQGGFVYTVRDFPSLTGTFVGSVLVGKKEQVRLDDEAIVTLGATTFILHAARPEEA